MWLIKNIDSLPVKQMTRFFLSGGLATITHIITASLYVKYIEKSVLFANIVGFIAAYGVSYLLHSRYVFKVKFNTKKFIRHFSVQLFSLFASIALSTMLIETSIYLKILLVSVLTPAITFFIHKNWTFSK